MAAFNYLPDVLETVEAERLATGFVFTEGPSWHPDGHYFFVDIRTNSLYRLRPGGSAELVTKTIGGNGTTFDLQGRLIVCEGEGRRVSRLDAAGKPQPIAERYRGGSFNRPNDVVCRSDGSLYFTDPDKRIPYAERNKTNCPPAPVNPIKHPSRIDFLSYSSYQSIIFNATNEGGIIVNDQTMYPSVAGKPAF